MLRHLTTNLFQLKLNSLQFNCSNVTTLSLRQFVEQNIIRKPIKSTKYFARALLTNNMRCQNLASNINNDVLLDDEKERRLKILKLEADIANQEGRRVPPLDYFKDHHWEHLLNLPSKSARFKYYGYLFQIHVRKEAKLMKKTEKSADTQARIERIRQERAENPHIVYGLGNVSMFLRIYDSTINHWMNNR